MPGHAIRTRPLLLEEQHQLTRPRGTKGDAWGCTIGVMLTAALIGCGVGTILQISIRALTQMTSVTLLIGVLAIAAAAWIARTAYGDAEARPPHVTEGHGTAEVLEIWDPIVVQQLAHADEGPLYYLDIGAGKVLGLCGPALFEIPAHLEGRPWPSTEGGDDAEWKPPFLNTHFVLHRVAESGRILRIDVLGESIPVTRTLPVGTVSTSHPESFVFEGSLETLASSL